MIGPDGKDHPREDDEYWRQAFVDAVNQGMERDDEFGELTRDAVKKVTGQEGPIA